MLDCTNYKELFEEIKKYITLQVDYTKLTVVEKLVILLSALAVAMIVGALLICILFYVMMSLSHLLNQLGVMMWLAYLIVAAIYTIVLIGVVIFRQKLIIDPIAKFLSKLFLNPQK